MSEIRPPAALMLWTTEAVEPFSVARMTVTRLSPFCCALVSSSRSCWPSLSFGFGFLTLPLSGEAVRKCLLGACLSGAGLRHCRLGGGCDQTGRSNPGNRREAASRSASNGHVVSSPSMQALRPAVGRGRRAQAECHPERQRRQGRRRKGKNGKVAGRRQTASGAGGAAPSCRSSR